MTTALLFPWVLICVIGLVLPFGGTSRRKRTQDRALAYERGRRQATHAPGPARPNYEALDGEHALAVGTLADGTPVNLRRAIGLKHGLVVGASGSGKTRGLLDRLCQLILGMAAGLTPEVEIEVIDPKGETSDLLKASLAVLLITGPRVVAEWIRRHVWVAGWTRDRVTPMPPFDRADGRISAAYLADLRTQATAEASAYGFTDATRHMYRMYSQLATELGHPPNYAVCAALYTDAGLRARLLRDISDPFLRSYFESVVETMPRSTILALLRRVQYQLSFPEVRASIGLPVAAIDQLGLRRTGLVRIIDVSTRFALPPGMAGERATHRVIDVLRTAPRRDSRRPAVLVLEEAAALLARSPELVEPLASGVRTLRSVEQYFWYVAQDYTSALDAQLLEPLVLNSFWLALFQSRRDAAWLAEQIGDGSAEARRAFQRDIENLPCQTYYLWPKGYDVMRLRAMDCPDPAVEGLTFEDLLEIFDREVASASMVPIATADRLIAEWEASILGRREVAPPTEAAGPKRPYSMADLLHDLTDTSEEDPDA